MTEALHDGDRKVRSASARMLSRLGEQKAAAVPHLVQRLFEDTLLVRDHAAPALARLLPDLSPEVQRWLCVFANPLLPARVNLRAVLDRSDLPPTCGPPPRRRGEGPPADARRRPRGGMARRPARRAVDEGVPAPRSCPPRR